MVDSVLEVQNIKLPDSGGVTSSTAITLDANGVANFPNGLTYNSVGFIGHGQTWQDVTASRSSGVTYTNSTGKPIMISVRASSTGGSTRIAITIDGLPISRNSGYYLGGGASTNAGVTAIVPNGVEYSYSLNLGTVSFYELR